MSDPPVLNPFNVDIYPAPEPYIPGEDTVSEQYQPEVQDQPQSTETLVDDAISEGLFGDDPEDDGDDDDDGEDEDGEED